MSKSFFKPKFRIQRVAITDSPNEKVTFIGYVVQVKYWWLPIWCDAFMPVKDSSSNRTSNTTAFFNDQEDAIEYVSRRYTVIDYNDFSSDNEQQGE
jgi:hypothetical protein